MDLGWRAQDEGVLRRKRGGDEEIFSQHGVQPASQFRGRAAGDRRLAGSNDMQRHLLVLPGSWRRQGGIPKPTLLPRFGVSIRSHGEKTQEQQDYRVPGAHRSILESERESSHDPTHWNRCLLG